MAGVYPDLSKIILRLLLPFPTTYRCEAVFSTLVNVKTKSRSGLKTVTHNMRVALSRYCTRYCGTFKEETSPSISLAFFMLISTQCSSKR